MGSRKHRGRPPGPSLKGDQTHQRLYVAALVLFDQQGYEHTTMRAIARAAGTSPGLLYRYFPSKRALVLTLYEQLSAQYASAAEPLPEGGWATRFFSAVATSLEVLTPHRNVLQALTGVLAGSGEEGIFSPTTAFSREQVMAVFVQAAEGADDAPENAQALGRMLYLAHLGIIMSWLLDKSPEQAATLQLLETLAGMSNMLGLVMLLPAAAPLLHAGDTFVRAGLFGEEDICLDPPASY